MKYLKKTDPKLLSLIKLEEKRQQETLMMIPSENIASRAVEEAVGSVLGNKYAEGYPGKRYYQGQGIVDQIETLVIERAKSLFKVPYVNVQPLSGSPANFAVYTALLDPGDTLMGLALAHGGHLTHGARFNASSKYFRSVPYELNEKGFINYDQLFETAKKEKPKIIVAGITAYPRVINWKKFADIAKEVNAYLMADIAHIAGLIAADEYPSPVPFVHIITTTTHKTLRGPRGAMIMVTDKGIMKDPELGIKINKAIIPGIQGGPHLNTIAGIGVALKEASTKKFKKYAHQIIENAAVLADNLNKYDIKLVSGGTDSHLILIDLRNKNILGNTAAEGCEAAGIILNYNGVPFDSNPPLYPSGIRLGTPGITSRGMKKREMKLIAHYLVEIIEALKITKEKLGYSDDEERKRVVRQEIILKTPIIKKIRREITVLCRKFPVKLSY